ncbi:MAG: putative toxin-antitoxin system toxin component, PIN family [Bacteroidetes bacterium GWA2_31_9]|nr:MAG: putative toxin-antitoxin system toxin component, PIN family [Bacteroidetes bacterium GWA2_31_9]
MIKLFVFDTNLIISAHLSKHSISRKAYDLAFEIGLVLRSDNTFEELVTTFTKAKFEKYLSIESRIKAINEFESKSLLISVTTGSLKACRDPKDDKFLSLAKAGNASAIITGDKDLLILNPFENISIVTPDAFLKLF